MDAASPPRKPPTLRDSLRSALRNRALKSQRRRLTIVSDQAVDFSSNDFLSLSTSPIFRARYLAHLQAAPPLHPFASGGSRLLDGNSRYAEELEAFIAEFHRAPCGLLFGSGYDANVGVFSCIPQPGDVIVYDELVHASAREGMRLSRAGRKIKFTHSSPASLAEVLRAEIEADPLVQDGSRNVFIAVESLYSMDGDLAPLQEFVSVVEELLPHGNGYFIVDEAHATGSFGPRGAGLVQELGLERKMFIRVHTFGKALASNGAIVLCCPDTREYLVNYARSLIYTTAPGFPLLASIRTAYELLSEGLTQPHQSKLQHLIQHLRTRLESLGPSSPIFSMDHHPRSPIFSLRSKVPRELAAACQESGYVVRAIVSPTVPVGMERVRVCLHAGNTEGEVDGLVGVIRGWLGEVGEKGEKRERNARL